MPSTDPYDLPIHDDQPWEVSYWCWVLDATPEALHQAVRAAGPRAVDVKAWLERATGASPAMHERAPAAAGAPAHRHDLR